LLPLARNLAKVSLANLICSLPGHVTWAELGFDSADDAVVPFVAVADGKAVGR